jgi:hypothetical protein
VLLGLGACWCCRSVARSCRVHLKKVLLFGTRTPFAGSAVLRLPLAIAAPDSGITKSSLLVPLGRYFVQSGCFVDQGAGNAAVLTARQPQDDALLISLTAFAIRPYGWRARHRIADLDCPAAGLCRGMETGTIQTLMRQPLIPTVVWNGGVCRERSKPKSQYSGCSRRRERRRPGIANECHTRCHGRARRALVPRVAREPLLTQNDTIRFTRLVLP